MPELTSTRTYNEQLSASELTSTEPDDQMTAEDWNAIHNERIARHNAEAAELTADELDEIHDFDPRDLTDNQIFRRLAQNERRVRRNRGTRAPSTQSVSDSSPAHPNPAWTLVAKSAHYAEPFTQQTYTDFQNALDNAAIMASYGFIVTLIEV